MRISILRLPVIVAAVLALIFATLSHDSSAATAARKDRRIRIVYDELVDRSTLTHSGRTVGTVLSQISGKRPPLPTGALSDLQPYVQPFSFACNEVAEALRPATGETFRNIADDYPPGSAQPAWAALFREGLYQLFVGTRTVRLFIEGDSPSALLSARWGVVRHPLRAAFEKTGASSLTVEVYAFRNDYASRTVVLDPVPHVVRLTPADLGPKVRPMPLAPLASFLSKGPVVEAVGFDGRGDIAIFGRGAGAVLDGATLSIADLAVVYRAVFHHGRNAPYLSLDPDEDNRNAKANFGGLLEDTRVGSVLLEADRIFKTISTGLDARTRKLVVDDIRKAVPEFRTIDEKTISLPERETVKIRFWFYPDKIRTVSDGRLGVIEAHRFLADEERLEGSVRKQSASREAITHLNKEYDRYAAAFPTFRELDTVGRLMAVVKWMHSVKADRSVDLDALLSVELPPMETPHRLRKILAATDFLRIARGPGKPLEFTRIDSLDNVLSRGGTGTSDLEFLDLATKELDSRRPDSLLPPNTMFCPSQSTRVSSASISGGVSMDPKAVSPPRVAPSSPLLARFRRELEQGGGGGGGMSLRSSSGSLPAPADAKRPGPAFAGPYSVPVARLPKPAVASPTASAPSSTAPRPVRLAAGFSARAYPSEILVTGDLSTGDTVVLKKGKPTVGPKTGASSDR